MLMCEQDTTAMGKKVLSAARKHFHKRGGIDSHFEHGQWWILFSTGAIYSVCDAEGVGTTEGFDFEQVSEDEDY